MGETINEIVIPPQLTEAELRRLARQVLVDTVPPYDDDSFSLLVEL